MPAELRVIGAEQAGEVVFWASAEPIFRYGRRVGEVKYTSRVRIERVRGPLRRAYLPAESEPVVFGVHDAVAAHYGVAPGGEAERATTLDYVVAAAAG